MASAPKNLQPAHTKYLFSDAPGCHDRQACYINCVHLREPGKFDKNQGAEKMPSIAMREGTNKGV